MVEMVFPISSPETFFYFPLHTCNPTYFSFYCLLFQVEDIQNPEYRPCLGATEANQEFSVNITNLKRPNGENFFSKCYKRRKKPIGASLVQVTQHKPTQPIPIFDHYPVLLAGSGWFWIWQLQEFDANRLMCVVSILSQERCTLRDPRDFLFVLSCHISGVAWLRTQDCNADRFSNSSIALVVGIDFALGKYKGSFI